MNASTHHACHVAAPEATETVVTETTDPRTIRVALEARPTNWEVAPGIVISGYG